MKCKGFSICLLLFSVLPLFAQSNIKTAYQVVDTVFVAPPTGDREIDRASIMAALDHQGVSIAVYEPGTSCRDNIIRNNIIEVRQGKVLSPTETDSSFAGNSLALHNFPEALRNNGPGQESFIEANIIEGDRIIGGDGLGIEMLYASRNHIRNNTITAIKKRVPFLGDIFDPRGPALEWSVANGSGISISKGSNENIIKDNKFENIAAVAVHIEGDSNLVDVRQAGNLVRASGTGNRINVKEDSINPLYESKFVETRGIRLQYMDFGGEGLPVIFLQDFHDYFSIKEEESQYSSWLARFADEYKVLAPVRRGWGESDDTRYGYDVATQAEDLLGLMDALQIERAVLVGRIPANQDMTWIAEHHPERIAGLIYIGNPRVFAYPNEPEVKAFQENYVRGVCDADKEEAEKWEQRTGARQTWRPHFFSDPEASINIPTLRFYDPVWEGMSLNLLRLQPERIKELAASDHCGDEQAQKYFAELAADESRLENLRKVFRETDTSQKLNETMERAFGSSMKTVVEKGLEGADAMYDFYFPNMRRFLREIELLEKDKENKSGK